MSVVTDSNELLGHALGSCVLQSLIGHGGMGAVYLAQQARPRRQVAVKVLMPGIPMDTRSRAEFLARFRREADAIAALDHINIMPVYEYGEEDNLAYIVMPHVTGGTLRERLAQRGALPLPEIISIMDQAASALDCAHAQGIVHRDLKPGNILFHADGRVLLADFGLAKVIKDVTEPGADGVTLATLTSTGTIVGTPEYLSPEQGTGNPIDYRSDVYSLGVVLFQMLTGRVPFTGTSPVAIVIKHTMEAPPPPSQLNPAIPHSVDAVVLKALAKKPEQRYASAGELAHALRIAVSDQTNGHTLLDTTQGQNRDELATPMIRSNEPIKGTPPPDVHTASTEASPQRGTVPQAENTPIEHKPTVIEMPTVASPPEAPVVRSLGQQAMYKQINPLPKRQGSRQSVGMMILGSLITLVLVIGGFAFYLHSTPLQKPGSPTSQATSTPAPYTPPTAMVPQAGSLLYATPLPGKACDHYGGQWSIQANAKVLCHTSATELANTGTQNLAGTFLTLLPKGQPIPNNYVLQIQVSNVQGNFGVFFRSQPGSQPGGYSFIIAPSGNWNGYAYDNKTGSAGLLYGQQGIIAIHGTVTIDVVIQANTFSLYFNGVRQGGIESTLYSSGSLGLVVDEGASASFQNLAIYSLA
jgi:serine/threonine protein kinase